MRVALRVVPGLCIALVAVLSVARYPAQTTSADSASPYRLSPGALASMKLTFTTKSPKAAPVNGQAHAAHGTPGVDSLPNFNGHFHLTGYNIYGNLQSDWYTNTVGNMPGDGGTTIVGGPVIPVSVELLDAKGNQAYDPTSGQPLYYDATQYAARTLNSPVYQNYTYSSSQTPTQYTDAVQRAEYYRKAPANWHTVLAPRLAPARVLQVPAGEYYYVLNPDGTCCLAVFVNDGDGTFDNGFFVQDIVPSIVDGSITQQDMASFLFPNTFLYFGDLSNCCGGGYHSYVYEPASPATGNVEIRWVLNYSSWISPGIFKGADDVVALSHELAETFNDPFVGSDLVHNFVPWWRSGFVCSPVLEVGDVIESLPNPEYPITMNGMTYHPQNVALLQWFEGSTKSDAIGGAFSYPDTTVLTSPMVPQKPGCP